MNKPIFHAAVSAVSACLLLGACAPTTPRIDSRFGESLRTTLAQQTRNPDAGVKPVPEVVEGATARESIERYRASYKEPSQQSDGYGIGLSSGRSR